MTISNLQQNESFWELPGQDGRSIEYRIGLATTRTDRERAYQMVYKAYLEAGLIDSNQHGFWVVPQDAQPSTASFLIEDNHGVAVGTMTLNFDGANPLPCHAIYPQEVNALKKRGRRLVEVTKYAMADRDAARKTAQIHLYNFCILYARCVCGSTDMLIEVHPRHAAYYQYSLMFVNIGEERDCPRVKNAPALLMHLDLSHQKKEIQLYGGTRKSGASKGWLYPWFMTLEDEIPVAEFLKKMHRPMSSRQKRYFNLNK